MGRRIPGASTWTKKVLAAKKTHEDAKTHAANAEAVRAQADSYERIRAFKPILDYVERARKAGFEKFPAVDAEVRVSTFYRVVTESWGCDDGGCTAGYGVGLDEKGFFTFTYRESGIYARDRAYYDRKDHKTRKDCLTAFLDLAKWRA